MRLQNAQLRALLQADTGLHLKVLQNIVAILAARIVHLNTLMRDQLRSRAGRGGGDAAAV